MSERKDKFTPGPWYVYDTRERAEQAYDYYITAGQYLVAAVSPNSLDIQEANASLIAASPEMYEFIKSLTSFGGQVLLATLGEDGLKIYDEALRILAKAKGEVQE